MKYNGNKNKQAGNGQRPLGVDEGVSGRRDTRQRIEALETVEQREKKKNSIHSVMMAFVDVPVFEVLGFSNVFHLIFV